MKQYSWRSGGPKPPIEAQVFGTEVEKISNRLGLEYGHVKAEHVVEAAEKRGSPLRALFPFNDVEGSARAHWASLARNYLGSLQIVTVEIQEGRATSARGFYSVPLADGRRGYVSRDQVLSERDLKVSVIGDAKRELESYLKKYTTILTMGTYIPQLQEVIDAMRDEVDQLETSANKRKPVHDKSDDEGPRPEA